MLQAVDFDPATPTSMPDVPSIASLQKFGNTPERHEAYEVMWNGITYLGVLANAAFWLYL